MYASHIHNRYTHAHVNIFKVIKDIAAGQEIFYRYGGAKWFERKKVPYADVDYASTRWRPDLEPLPCRQDVIQTTGADGRRSYAVGKAVPSGTVLEISLCLEVPVIVVDQFPFLWDFVLTGETEHVHAACQQTTHTVCVFADQDEGKIGKRAELVLYFISSLTLSRCPNLYGPEACIYASSNQCPE